jgi:hypothetical protein
MTVAAPPREFPWPPAGAWHGEVNRGTGQSRFHDQTTP